MFSLSLSGFSSVAQVSRHASFARSMTRNNSYLDPGHKYRRNIAKAAVGRQLSVSQLEFKELWTQAGRLSSLELVLAGRVH